MKRKTALLTIAAAASVAGLGLSAPALAAETSAGQKAKTAGLQDCPANAICGWSGTNFTGAMRTFLSGSCASSPFPLRSIAVRLARQTDDGLLDGLTAEESAALRRALGHIASATGLT